MPPDQFPFPAGALCIGKRAAARSPANPSGPAPAPSQRRRVMPRTSAPHLRRRDGHHSQPRGVCPNRLSRYGVGVRASTHAEAAPPGSPSRSRPSRSRPPWGPPERARTYPLSEPQTQPTSVVCTVHTKTSPSDRAADVGSSHKATQYQKVNLCDQLHVSHAIECTSAEPLQWCEEQQKRGALLPEW